MTDFDKIMETELLKRVSEKGKINLMTETPTIMNSGQLSCLCHSSLATFVQTQFLKSNLMFSYDLLQSRNGVKIAGLSKGHTNGEDVEFIKSYSLIDENIAIHILNQFYDYKDEVDIMSIAAVYNSILKMTTVKNLFVSLNEDLIDKIYTISKEDFSSRQHLEQTVTDIKKYGYCFEKDNETYWKLYKTNVEINNDKVNDFFTVISEIIEEESKCPIVEKEKIVTKEFTAQDALNLLAQEIGLIPSEKINSKLEEVIAITDELISNFDSMQDWEKLMNWNKFVSDWKTIMGDALNDRN